MDDDATSLSRPPQVAGSPSTAGCALENARTRGFPELDVLIHHLGLDTMVFSLGDGPPLVVVPDGPET